MKQRDINGVRYSPTQQKKGQKHFMRLRSLRTPVDDDRWRRCQNEPKIQRKIPRWGSKGKYQNQENWMRRHTAIILAAGVKNLFFFKKIIIK